MANPERGEVDIQVGDKRYRFVLTLNAMVELEDKVGQSFGVYVAGRTTVRQIRTVFWAAAREHHPDLDEAAVGNVLGSVGGPNAFVKLFEQLLKATNATEADKRAVEAKGGTGARPSKAQTTTAAGIGESSKSKRAANSD